MMIRLQSLKRIIGAGLVNFRRNYWLSIGTTGVMILALLVLLGLVVTNLISGEIVRTLQNKVDVTAYFKFEAKETQIIKIKEDLEALPEVLNVEYVSREQALAEFKQRHIDDELIQESLAELDENPLQAALNIKARNSTQYASIASFLEENTFRSIIDKVNFFENQIAIEKIGQISRGLKVGGLIITLILASVAVLITFNTIRLTIYTQRKEIEVMKLVGASDWHVQGPFIVEGIMYGAIAGLAALVIYFPSTYMLNAKLGAFLPSINLFAYSVSFFGQIAGLVLFVGIFLGAVSSTIAIRRYLKV